MGVVNAILRIVRAAYPDVACEQLQVAHPGADDDGLWFITRPGVANEVQIESSTQGCPFLIEHERTPERWSGDTIDDVAKRVIALLAAG